MKLKYFFGFVLIVFGALLLLQNIKIIPGFSLWSYFLPIVLMGIGIVNTINTRKANTINIFLIIVGGILLFDALGLLYGVRIRSIILPLVIIFIGFKLINAGGGRFIKPAGYAGNRINAFSLFSISQKKYVSDNFHTGEATALFGECVLDISESHTTLSNCYLEANAVFGSIKIIVPADWHVSVKVTPFFGGCENRTAYPANPKTTLTVTGNAIFGGIQIKNMH